MQSFPYCLSSHSPPPTARFNCSFRSRASRISLQQYTVQGPGGGGADPRKAAPLPCCWGNQHAVIRSFPTQPTSKADGQTPLQRTGLHLEAALGAQHWQGSWQCQGPLSCCQRPALVQGACPCCFFTTRSPGGALIPSDPVPSSPAPLERKHTWSFVPFCCFCS